MCDLAPTWYATISARDRRADRSGFLIPPSRARWDPDARGLDDPVRGSGAALRRVPRPHRVAAAPRAPFQTEGALRAVRAGPTGVGRRPTPQPRLSRAPHLPAGARLRATAAGPGRQDLLPTARPLEAAMGDLAGRGPEGRPFRGRRQDPSRDGRRRLRS